MALLVVDTTVSEKLEVPERFSSRAEGYYYARLPNNGGWKAVALDLRIAATQTYGSALLTPVDLDVIWGVGRVIQTLSGNQYQFDIQKHQVITWNLPTDDEKVLTDDLDIPAALEGQDRYFIMKLVYRLPTGSSFLDSVTFEARFGALVSSATGGAPPTWGNYSSDEPQGGVEAWLQWLPFIALGVLGVAGLFALGYASEKTGINAGAVGGLYGELKTVAGRARGKRGQSGGFIQNL